MLFGLHILPVTSPFMHCIGDCVVTNPSQCSTKHEYLMCLYIIFKYSITDNHDDTLVRHTYKPQICFVMPDMTCYISIHIKSCVMCSLRLSQVVCGSICITTGLVFSALLPPSAS